MKTKKILGITLNLLGCFAWGLFYGVATVVSMKVLAIVGGIMCLLGFLSYLYTD